VTRPQTGSSTGKKAQFDKKAKYDAFDNAVVLGSNKVVQKMFVAARQTGSLKLNNRKLDSFPAEIVALHDVSNVSSEERWWENVDLLHIDLSHNEISSIPAGIAGLDQLLTLNLAENKLDCIPREMASLFGLKRLDLSKNKLRDLPELEGLTGLTELLLNDNALAALPASVGAMRSLESLNVDNNQLRELPVGLGEPNNILRIRLTIIKLIRCFKSADEAVRQPQ
jgi:Leucine-rich repeat (LRR) protein